jgi:transmembrane sensor
MTDQMSSQSWQRLAQKMVCTYTGEKMAELKADVVARHHRNARNARILFTAGAILLVGMVTTTLIWQLAQSEMQKELPQADLAALTNSVAPPEQLRASSVAAETHADDTSVFPVATPLTSGTRYELIEKDNASVYRITSGYVRFQTHSTGSRKLLVQVGDLAVEDIGTVFTVETLADEQVRVAVSEGRVKVSWPSGHAELKAGTDGVFPGGVPQLPAAPLVSKNVVSGGGAVAEIVSPVNWRDAARRGDNELALELIERNPSTVRYSAGDLLLAADVMRLTGHSQRAVALLKKVVKGFPGDSRRTAAAFTLGKVLLEELGNPRAAARAFGIAARHASPLKEEAMAREAEAWYRAGDSSKAKSAAQKYLAQFSQGARADSIKSFYDETD